jgi:sugar lactone lactonase YvrE
MRHSARLVCLLLAVSVLSPSIFGQIINTFAGTGAAAFSGDGGPAQAAAINGPWGVTVDNQGNIFIADTLNNIIRKVSASTGIITTVAGNRSFAFGGDGGPATQASLAEPTAVAVDSQGNLYIADFFNHRIRKVSGGIITTVAGSGAVGSGNGSFSGDGGPATSATLNLPFGVAVDGSGNLFIADHNNHRIRKVSGGIITTVAGSGGVAPASNGGFTGDGGPATSATLSFPDGVTVDGSGNLFIADTSNSAIRKVNASTGIITTVAGSGTQGFSGDGGLATAARLFIPEVTAIDSAGNIFIGDGFNNRVRLVTTNGIISTVAGSGPTGSGNGSFSGDGGQATAATLSNPFSVALDAAGNLYIADNVNNRIRRVASSPIPTVASLFPNCLDASAAGMNVRITGTGFSAGSVVRWNGSARATQFVSTNTLNAIFTSADLGAAATAAITVFTPAPGGGTSTPFSVTVPRSCTDNQATAPPVIQTPASLSATSTSSPASTVAPPCGNQNPANGVWMSATAPADGTYNANTLGSTYQTIFAVYTGPVTNLTNVGCSAAPPGSFVRGDTILPLAAALALPVTKGKTYLFLVTAANSDGGKLQFNLSFTGSARIAASAFTTILPHMVNGAGYITKLTVVNMSGATNNVVINLLGQDGSIQSTQTILMQAGQTVRLAAPESSRNVTPQTVQWVTVGGDGRVAVNLFFEVEDGNGTVINCIGFNDASSALNFTVPVEFEPKPANASIGRTVGVALANPSASSNTITLTLLDQNGATLGTKPVTLAAFAQTGIDLSSATTGFGSVLPASNFIGSLNGSSITPFNVLALGDDFGPFFATPSLTSATTQVVPHIVSGAGYVTKITLVNLSAGTNTVTVTYFNQAGVQQGTPHSFVIPAFGTARDTTGEANRFTTPAPPPQWAVVTSTASAGVNLFFEFMDSPTARLVVNTVGFNAAPELTTFTVPVEYQPGTGGAIGRTMGFAVANRNGSAASMTVSLLNNQGSVIATHPLTLAAGAQTTFNVDTVSEFAAVLPASNFIGTLVVTSNLPVAAIALEDDLGPFSATPVISGRP